MHPVTTLSAVLARLVLPGMALALAGACATRSPTSPTDPPPLPTGTVPIMGASRLTAAQLVARHIGRRPQPSGTYAATVPVATAWNQMGNRHRATAGTHATSILSLYTETLKFNGLS